MQTTDLYAAVLYLLTFRLAIIALGGLSIYLGYRLFTQALPRRKGSDEVTELEAKFGNNELTLRSVGPGIFFALFGAAIIVLTLNKPEVQFNWQVPVAPVASVQTTPAAPVSDASAETVPKTEPPPLMSSGSVAMKGAPEADNDAAHRHEGPSSGPEHAHEHVWQQIDSALSWAQRAVADSPANAEYLDSLAALYFLNGDFKAAVATQEKAAEQAPGAIAERMQKKLAMYQRAIAE